MDLNVGALVEVEWYDSERVTLGWASAEDYLAALKDRSIYRTAGYYVGEDADHVMVSHSRSDSGSFGDAMVIPRAVVIQMRGLAILNGSGDTSEGADLANVRVEAPSVRQGLVA